MGICVFCNYKIKIENNFSYISDYEFNEPTYDHGTEVFEKIIGGGELMEMIAKELNDEEVITFFSNDNMILIEKFNPHDGTGSDIKILYEEIKK